MKNFTRITHLLVSFNALMLCGCNSFSSVSTSSIEEISTYSLTDNRLRTFLDSNDAEEQLSFLTEYGKKRLDKQYLKLNPTKGLKGEYQFYYDTDPSFSSPFFYFPKWGEYPMCIPGKTYYYKLFKLTGTDEQRAYKNFDNSFTFPDGELVKEGTFKTKNEPVRYLNFDKIGNFRDLGGWKTTSGKTITYGKIYRSPSLDTVSNFTKCQLSKMLNIKTEIDLREESTITESSFGANFILAPTKAYDTIFKTNFSATSYKTIFKSLAKEETYPLVFHCAAGADRTGTLAFLINGLLGVDLDSLTKDFELTSFSDYGYRCRGPLVSPYSYGLYQNDSDNYVNWLGLIEGIKSYSKSTEDTLQKCIENYLLDIGITASEIESIKTIMLEETPNE